MSKGGTKLKLEEENNLRNKLDDCLNCDENQVQLELNATFVCPPNTFTYIVQPGDTMFTIARKFGVSLDALIAANPQIPDPSKIVPGQTVCIPSTTTSCPPNTSIHIVQAGDTMFTIARKFGVSLDALIAANPQIKDPSKIVPGQTVCVPGKVGPGQCPPNTTVYIVQSGDTMFLIARKFGVSLEALVNANPQIPNPSQIRPGQTVCVPKATPSPQCPPGSTKYTVKTGDTMFLIARRFGVSLNSLIRANPQISDPSRISPGQIICIPPK